MTFPWLFHDQLKFSMTQKCWKPSLLGAYFFSVTRRIFPVFKQHEIFGPKKWNSMTFPWPRLFSLKSMTFPGLENAFSNSMTFHDFSWPYEPCRNISVPGLTTAGISPQDCLSLYSTCVPSSLNDLLVNKKLKDLSLLVHSHTLSSTLGDLTHLLTYMHAHTSISYRRITHNVPGLTTTGAPPQNCLGLHSTQVPLLLRVTSWSVDQQEIDRS